MHNRLERITVIRVSKLPLPVIVKCCGVPSLLTCLTSIGSRAAGRLLARNLSKDGMSMGCRTGPAIFVCYVVCRSSPGV